MRKAPWSPRLLALILGMIAFSFPVQVGFLYGHGFTELPMIFAKLTVLNYSVMLGCCASAYFLWNCDRLSLPLLGATSLLVAWNNYLVGYLAYDFSMTATTLGTLLFMGTFSCLMHPHAIAAFKEPSVRWWRAHKRKRVSLPTEVHHTVNGNVELTEIFDLSNSGAYLLRGGGKNGYHVGDFCNVNIKVSDYKKLKLLAKIVRLSEGAGQYPAGMGLQFQDLESEDAQFLKVFLDDETSSNMRH